VMASKSSYCLVLALLLIGTPLAAAGAPNSLTLRIAHFGNLDGAFTQVPCRADRRGRVTFANLLEELSEVRKEGHTLVLSSGNVLGDAPFFDFLFRQGESGIASLTNMLQASGVELLVPGVTEFLVPYRMFLEFLPDFHKAGCRYRAANVRSGADKATALLSEDAVLEREFDGVKVVVIPVLGPAISGVVQPDNISGITIATPVEETNELAAKARAEGAQLVVALANLEASPGGTGATIDFARKLRGVDIVIAGGMADDGETEPVIRSARIGPERVWLVGTPRAPEAFGVVTVRLQQGRVRWKIEAIEASNRTVSSFRRDDEVAEMLLQATSEFCSLGGRYLGTGIMDPPMSQRDFLSYVLEIVRREWRTDLSVLSLDSLRGEQSMKIEGPVTAGFLARSFSRHEVMVISVMGQDLSLFVTAYFTSSDQDLRKKLVLAGACRLADGTIEINERPIHSKRRYTIATSDFLASGGRSYLAPLLAASATKVQPTRFFLREMVHRYFDRDRFAEFAVDGRISKVTSFPLLWDRPLWEFNLTLNGGVTNVSIANPGDYAETQLTSRSPNTGIKGDGQFLAIMSTRDHRVSEFLKAQYGMIQIGDKDFNETQDLVTEELQYAWTGWRNRKGKGRFWIPAPFARGKLETEFSPSPKVFEKGEDGLPLLNADGSNVLAYDPYHHLEVTGVAGLEWLFGSKASVGLGYGLRSELLATPGSAAAGLHAGVDLYYQINSLPLHNWGSSGTLSLDSRFGLFYADWSDTRTLKSSGSTKLIASVVGPLSFTLGFDFFLYRSGDTGLAYAYDTMAGLAFSYDAAIQQF
jgi:2',3'-cyclic-nucleotide 2'-phosphodiesterase (5'-nucleotidase family)